MGLYLRLAWRNIWRHRRRTVILVASIAFTLMMMMVYDGMMVGFQNSIYVNAIKVLGGNIQVHAAGYQEKANQMPLIPLTDDQKIIDFASSQSQVELASRRITTGGMASNHEGAFGVTIIGLEPDREKPTSIITQNTRDGRFLENNDADKVVIGHGLAAAMELKVGDQLTLVGKATHDQMRKRTMTVVGIYDLGLTDMEKKSVYISLAEAQDLYDLSGQTTEITISLKQIGKENGMMKTLKSAFPGYEFESWETNYPDLQSAITKKSSVMNIFSIVLLVIAGIGIMNLLLMAIFERTREIGVLGALGMKPGQISILFLLEGIMMGLVGVAAGIVFGFLINFILSKVGMDFSAFTSMTEYTALIQGKVYTTLGFENLISHVITIIVISLLASYYPASEAAKNDPAVSLHAV
jgi:ABC-type lipoprotein release transport system permease subunit